jgi:glycosyltransferase involved in cell wall biosynthesis
VVGVWAHRQALAAARAGAEAHVIVLHRVVPPLAAMRRGRRATGRALAERLRQPRHETRDGLPVTYVPFISPPRPSFYPYWGAWAAPGLAAALRALRGSFAFELIHAHNAVPAGDAVRHLRPGVPVAVSVHGSDVLYTARSSVAGARAVSKTLGASRVVLANSHGIADLARDYGARNVWIVHLGTDMPADDGAASALAEATMAPPQAEARGDSPEHPLERLAAELPEPGPAAHKELGTPALVTVGHLVARKRHADVVHVLAALSLRHPQLRYLIIGDGPERDSLGALAASLGIGDRVEIVGQLSPREALRRAWRCTLFVMPSTEEAFGVAYIEAMAGGLPAIGCRSEPGPQEIAASGEGLELVEAGDLEGLARRIDELLTDRERLRSLGEQARKTVTEHFTWERCAAQTLAAYELALR